MIHPADTPVSRDCLMHPHRVSQLVIDELVKQTGITTTPAPVIPVIKIPDINNNQQVTVNESKPTIGDIFRLYGNEYRKNNKLTVQQQKVMYSIEHCRTGDYGFNVTVCDTCGNTIIQMNSCRNRHCPQCQGNKRSEWVKKRLDDLLPVPYYHVVFTLPVQFYPMCLYNQKMIYDLLFRASSDTLKEFGMDPKWLGGKTGFFGVLHTWGQLLVVHLHIHYIMPAVGIDENGNRILAKNTDKFLFPVHAVSKVFRGKFIAGLKQAKADGKLEFPGEIEEMSTRKGFNKWINSLYEHQWVVYSKPPYGSPEEMIKYAGRYTHQAAISNSRIISIDNGVVRFSYKNYKKLKEITNREELWEETELPVEEFIRRFLFHAVPENYHRIHHYGFLGNGQKSKRLELRETLTADELKVTESSESSETIRENGNSCPQCSKGKMITVLVIDRYNRIIKGSFSEINRLTSIPNREESCTFHY